MLTTLDRERWREIVQGAHPNSLIGRVGVHFEQLEAALRALVDDRDAGHGDAAEGCSVSACGYCGYEMSRAYEDGQLREVFPHAADCPIAQARALLEVK